MSQFTDAIAAVSDTLLHIIFDSPDLSLTANVSVITDLTSAMFEALFHIIFDSPDLSLTANVSVITDLTSAVSETFLYIIYNSSVQDEVYLYDILTICICYCFGR
jgi:hypothetical protein